MGILNIDEHVEEHRLLNIRYPGKAVIPGSSVIALCTLPFWLPPGDGGSNGLAFSGSGGDFTLSAAIITNIGLSLGYGYCYFYAGFGGSSLPAGWYWTEMSSDTAGKVFMEQYVTGSGQPRRPATKTTIPATLTGRITGTTSEIVGPSGFILPGDALGKNGMAEGFFSIAGPTAGTKSFRMKLDGTTFFQNGGTTSPIGDSLHLLTCADSVSEKQLGRTSATAYGSIGAATTAYSTQNRVSIDTSVNREVSMSLQQSTNVSCAILMRAYLTATYGD